MSLQNEYELVIILRPDIDDAQFKTAVERVETSLESNGGTLLLRDDWGNRKLAYNVKNHSKGRYVLLSFLAEASLIAELERTCRLVEPVIRFLTSKIADAVDVPARVEEAAEVRRAQEEEAAKKAKEDEEAQKAEEEKKKAAEAKAEAKAKAEAEAEAEEKKDEEKKDEDEADTASASA